MEKKRYVIVCLLKGDALEFHEKLVAEVCSKFNVKPQRLPAHFTIKAPFELEDISEIDTIAHNFTKSRKKEKITIDGIGFFRKNVVYMKVNPSTEAQKVHDDFIKELKKAQSLEWKPNEGRDKVYHCTIVSKLREDKFDPIWEYVSSFNPKFELEFDNISILRWENYRWVTHKEFRM